MALAAQVYKVRRTLVRESGQPDTFEADFHISEGPGATFTLDDLIEGLNNLKTNQNVPGSARMGSEVIFSLRWQS